MWGNDPELTPEAASRGEKPKQSWINPQANELLATLGGQRAQTGWGVGGRLNGPGMSFGTSP